MLRPGLHVLPGLPSVARAHQPGALPHLVHGRPQRAGPVRRQPAAIAPVVAAGERGLPGQPAVRAPHHGAVLADGVAVQRVGERDARKVGFGPRPLRLPSEAAVRRPEDGAVLADHRHPGLGVGEHHSRERPGGWLAGGAPRGAPVGGDQDDGCTDAGPCQPIGLPAAHGTAVLGAREGHRGERVGRRRLLAVPGRAAVGRGEHCAPGRRPPRRAGRRAWPMPLSQRPCGCGDCQYQPSPAGSSASAGAAQQSARAPSAPRARRADRRNLMAGPSAPGGGQQIGRAAGARRSAPQQEWPEPAPAQTVADEGLAPPPPADCRCLCGFTSNAARATSTGRLPALSGAPRTRSGTAPPQASPRDSRSAVSPTGSHEAPRPRG